MKKYLSIGLISVFVLVGLAVAINVNALPITNLLSDDFGTGSDINNIPDWDEEGTDNDSTTFAKNGAISGDDIVSPNGGRFAKIYEQEWICRQVDTTGLSSLNLSYYWHGDTDAENGEMGIVEVRDGSSCTAVAGWLNLANNELDDNNNNADEGWSSLQTLSLPSSLDNKNNVSIRFRNNSSSSDHNEYFRVDGVLVQGVPIPNTANLTVIKHVVNTTGGTATASDFTMTVSPGGSFLGDEAGNQMTGLTPGPYTVSEDQLPGYSSSFSGDCNSSGVVNLIAGDNKTCTVTNTSVADACPNDDGWQYDEDQCTPDSVTVNAIKIICDNESDLPNGAGGANITSTTASDFIASHPNCHIEPEWQFQWANQTGGDLGRDFVGEAGAPYTTFTSSAIIPLEGITDLHLREVLPEGYIPFTYDQSNQSNANNVTAEFYCADDVLNYDNWDFIKNPTEGSTFYCVGWNVPTTPQCPTGQTWNGEVCACPQGQVWNQEQCVPEQNACEDEISTLIVYSDGTETNDSAFSTIATFIHSAWMNIPGATWIWNNFHVADPTNGETIKFTKVINIAGTPTSASITVATDNTYEALMNGTQFGSSSEENNFSSGNEDVYIITNMQNGNNTLEITVNNAPFDTTDPETNPAGLDYKLEITQNTCVPEPTPTDVCNNIEGNQASIPEGLISNGQGGCVEPEPPTDVCPNVNGIQTEGPCADTLCETPSVWNMDAQACVTPPTDVCSNIEGVQTSVPSGMTETGGICTTPTSGGGGGGGGGSSYVQCTDDRDNDDDGLIDSADPGCHSDGNANNHNSYVPSDSNEQNGQVLGASTGPGQVLGAETSCGIYLEKFLQKGRKNDLTAAVRLQLFLNNYLGAKLTIDGVIGLKTDSFIRKFQLAHKTNVLDPWGLKGPTGIVYLTTVTEINNIMCPTLNLPIPTLIPLSANPDFPPKL